MAGDQGTIPPAAAEGRKDASYSFPLFVLPSFRPWPFLSSRFASFTLHNPGINILVPTLSGLQHLHFSSSNFLAPTFFL
ncbi:hypothetical protein Pmani_019355 [Petrolisthes manimaculis]|uniref:Uncharacterized protein n=1 Tax=Petrolisthes manimaculis TaxID=1843537 RepID=A0AAE1PJ24_9EUCA|nr:hypothetical protein Pmani_019355 [Petrolisthes manimaculis]